ncbi:hypothetical protein UVI_02053500 [Ustilaginoidea virens]|uniref:Uncharacterized protein n=1 Tax=Ustilaginoidea virens TaxID=1159556 RepID=A0A1B5L2V2_USTVR|nr:hypothetical protein UVI_02053500 [Ustilaginoidea virens]
MTAAKTPDGVNASCEPFDAIMGLSSRQMENVSVDVTAVVPISDSQLGVGESAGLTEPHGLRPSKTPLARLKAVSCGGLLGME